MADQELERPILNTVAPDADKPATVDDVLQLIVDEYYTGCKKYAQALKPDSGDRVFWRIRLGCLQKYGALLAAALDQAEPDWIGIRDIAEQAVRQ